MLIIHIGTPVFTFQLYITVKKLNQTSVIKFKFFSREILDSKF